MLLSRRQKFFVLLSVDAVLAPMALLATFKLYGSAGQAAEPAGALLFFLFALAGLAGALSALFGLPRIKLSAYEQNGIARTTVFAAAVGVFGYLGLRALNIGAYPVEMMVVLTMIVLIGAVGARICIRAALIWLSRSEGKQQRVLIYGAGQTGIQLATALRSDDAVLAVAFVDDNPMLSSITVAGLPVYPPLKIEALIEALSIDRVVMAMPSTNRQKQARIAHRLETTGCDVSVLPSFAALVGEGDLLDHIQPANPSDFLNRQKLEHDFDELGDAYAGRSIMVTGAGGSIGSELARQILACAPKRLVLFEASEIALYQLCRELDELGVNAKTRIVPILGSVLDVVCCKHAMIDNKVEVVLHAAAYKHVNIIETNVLAGMRNNVIGTQVLAQAARAAGVARFILVSTDKAVRPKSMMGASKRLAELVLLDLASKAGDTLFSIVRFGNVLGSSGSVVPLFEDQIARGGPITLTDPEATRYFMTLREAAQLVLLAGNYTIGADVFVLDMGDPVAIRKLAEQMIESAGLSVADAANPDGDIEIEVIGLAPGEKLHEERVAPRCDLVKTGHPKIMRTTEQGLSQIEMARAMKALNAALEAGSEGAARTVVERWLAQSDVENARLHVADAV